MEYISYPIAFGDAVRKLRNAKKLNQIEFYRYLFPATAKTDENIKKTMNAIENGKRASVSIDFFMAICRKCDVSADYLIGNDQYRNYDVKYVCEYTGLSEDAVIKLHSWQEAANNGSDVSRIGEGFWGDEGERQVMLAYDKLYGLQYLKILNYLFYEYETKEKFNGKSKIVKMSNVGVLHALHLLCITKPYRVLGKALIEESIGSKYEAMIERDPYLDSLFDHISLDAASSMVLQDENDVWYPLNISDVFEQIARNQLNRSIDRLVESIKNDLRETQNVDVVHHKK